MMTFSLIDHTEMPTAIGILSNISYTQGPGITINYYSVWLETKKPRLSASLFVLLLGTRSTLQIQIQIGARTK